MARLDGSPPGDCWYLIFRPMGWSAGPYPRDGDKLYVQYLWQDVLTDYVNRWRTLWAFDFSRLNEPHKFITHLKLLPITPDGPWDPYGLGLGTPRPEFLLTVHNVKPIVRYEKPAAAIAKLLSYPRKGYPS